MSRRLRPAADSVEFGAFFYNVLDSAGESYMLYTLSGVPREKFERFPMPRNLPCLDRPSRVKASSARTTSLQTHVTATTRRTTVCIGPSVPIAVARGLARKIDI